MEKHYILIIRMGDDMTELETFQKIIDESNYIVFFGGAGVSTESGIPDFRSESGIFKSLEKYGDTPENLISHSYYLDHTEEFFDYYKDTLVFKDAEPNPAHTALAKLEKTGKLKAVITQNIDGLHQKAGSREVLELHGSIHRNYCMKCGRFYDAKYVKEFHGIPRCECGGMIKPDVVLYEEGLDDTVIREAVREIREADMLIIGGTSLVVYPAAGFVDYFHGKHLVVLNKSATSKDAFADLCIQEPIGEVLGSINIKE